MRRHDRNKVGYSTLAVNRTVVLVVVIYNLSSFQTQCNGFYVNYEKPKQYQKGDNVPITANKLTSPKTLSSLDYKALPLCENWLSSDNESVEKVPTRSKWQSMTQSLHGDSYYYYENRNTLQQQSQQQFNDNSIQIRMLQDSYCEHVCFVALDDDKTTTSTRLRWAVENDFRYNWFIDNLPAALYDENEQQIVLRYFGGIPVGGKSSKLVQEQASTTSIAEEYIYYNHYNFIIHYKTAKQRSEMDVNDSESYYIVKATIQPMSIDHLHVTDVVDTSNDTSSSNYGNYTLISSIDSCSATPTSNHREHTNYDMTYNIPHLTLESNNQQQSNQRKRVVHFTYDVQWIQDSQDSSYKSRWDLYLSMDHAVSIITFGMGILLGGIILSMVVLALYVWVMRDLSYKPIINLFETDSDDEDEYENNHQPPKAESKIIGEGIGDGNESSSACHNSDTKHQKSKYDRNEIQMWPLSTRIFFPPAVLPFLLCVIAGTGAQNLISGLIVVILVRCGILSQVSTAGQGNVNLITGAITVYAICGPPMGGYVTGRLHRIVHGELLIALAASLVTAILYPLIGIIVVWLVYDVLPPINDVNAPRFFAMSNMLPLLHLWIFYMWPVTVAFGWCGYKHGPMQYFPISKGATGYQDLNLQDSTNDTSTLTRTKTTSTSPTKSVSSKKEDTVGNPENSDITSKNASQIWFLKTTVKEEEKKSDDDYHEEEDYIHSPEDDNEIQSSFTSYGMHETVELPLQNLYKSDDYKSDDYAQSDPGNDVEIGDDANKNSSIDKSKRMWWKPTVIVGHFKDCFVSWNTFHWKPIRIPLLFCFGGILPLLSGFVNYSYGVAAPLFLGTYSITTFMILSFLLFVSNATAITVLLYYRQIRVAGSHNQTYYYQWWWASIATGSSAGLYLFLLSMSWLLRFIVRGDLYNVSLTTWTIYFLWFFYICVGVGLMTGFCGLAGVIVFNRFLYMYIIRSNECE